MISIKMKGISIAIYKICILRITGIYFLFYFLYSGATKKQQKKFLFPFFFMFAIDKMFRRL